jgi:hypothetical protein
MKNIIALLKFELNTDGTLADEMISHSRKLFHRQLQTQLATVLNQLSVPEKKQQADRIVINLGEISAEHFEAEFCQRLLWELPAKLRQQLREVALSNEWHNQQEDKYHSDLGGDIAGCAVPVRDQNTVVAHQQINQRASENSWLPGDINQQKSSKTGNKRQKNSAHSHYTVLASYLHSTVWFQDIPPDIWLTQLLAEPDTQWARLAGICLQMPKIGLSGRYFRATTLALLAKKLAPGVFNHQPISPGLILLATLCWYQNHTEVSVPVIPQKEILPELLVPGSISEEVLPLLTRPTLLPWRKVLEQQIASPAISLEEVDFFGSDNRPAELLPGESPETMGLKTAHHLVNRKSDPLNPLSEVIKHSANTSCTIPKIAVKGEVTRSVAIAAGNGDVSGLQLVSHAGLSLLWPLLPELLQITGIRQPGSQMDENQRLQAVNLLVYLAEGEVSDAIPCTTFSHWLCGVLPHHTPTNVPLSADQVEIVDQWLDNLGERIPGWQRLSGSGIRQLFLQRDGWLCHDSNTLYLPPQPADVLLAQWLWPLTILLLPWLQIPLTLSQRLPP